MIGYGVAKAAVHQLVASLSDSKSGLPANACVAAILPLVFLSMKLCYLLHYCMYVTYSVIPWPVHRDGKHHDVYQKNRKRQKRHDILIHIGYEYMKCVDNCFSIVFKLHTARACKCKLAHSSILPLLPEITMYVYKSSNSKSWLQPYAHCKFWLFMFVQCTLVC